MDEAIDLADSMDKATKESMQLEFDWNDVPNDGTLMRYFGVRVFGENC
jgi:hypothetical protein